MVGVEEGCSFNHMKYGGSFLWERVEQRRQIVNNEFSARALHGEGRKMKNEKN